MQYFSNCPLCEFTVLSMILLGGLIIFIGVDYYRCKKRKWGSNPTDAKFK